MKKSFCLILLTAIFFSCNNPGQRSEASADGMFDISLAPYGKPFIIRVPDTSSAQLSIGETSYGALNLRSGSNFGISIYEQSSDLVLRKDDIMNDEVNRLKTFITDEPASIMWESAITEPEFHFVLNRNIGGTDYTFEDIRGVSYSAGAVKTMYKSAKEARAHDED